MKTIIVVFAFLIVSFYSFGQHKSPCDKRYSVVGSMSMGGSTKGTTMNLELGLWGKKNGIGVSGGVMFYDGDSVKDVKTGFINRPLINEYYLRATYKLDHNSVIEEGFHHAITIFGGNKGNGGVSYRAYFQCGTSFMIGIEPYISIKNGQGLNFITTFAF